MAKQIVKHYLYTIVYATTTGYALRQGKPEICKSQHASVAVARAELIALLGKDRKKQTLAYLAILT